MCLQVTDNYKLMVLLPKLKMYNGKDISRLADHVRTTSRNILKPKVTMTTIATSNVLIITTL